MIQQKGHIFDALCPARVGKRHQLKSSYFPRLFLFLPGLEPARPETEIQQKGHIFDALPGSGREARSIKEFTFLLLLPGLEPARPETEIQQKGHTFDALPGSVDLSIFYINMCVYI